MRVLAACSLGGAGHLNPLVPFLAAARQRDDEVLVIGPPALAELVRLAGFPFVAGGEPPESEVAPIRERLPIAPSAEASVLGNRELFARLAATAMLPAVERICAEWSPDLILRDPCEYASAVVASRLGIRTAQVAISLAEAEANSITVAAPALEDHRRGLVEEIRASPYLTRLPGSLDPSPFPVTVRIRDVGAPDAEQRPSMWWGKQGAPRVYLSFGTVLGHMTMAAGVYRTALMAFEDLDVDVLLSVGRRFDPTLLEPTPPHVRIERWVDQAAALAEAHLVVCHGGSGTAFGALAAGVPVVAVPLFADQFENARRIAEAGAGIAVDSGDMRNVEGAVPGGGAARRIRDAVMEVLGSPSYRDAAQHIAREMAAAPDVEEVLDALRPG